MMSACSISYALLPPWFFVQELKISFKPSLSARERALPVTPFDSKAQDVQLPSTSSDPDVLNASSAVRLLKDAARSSAMRQKVYSYVHRDANLSISGRPQNACMLQSQLYVPARQPPSRQSPFNRRSS